MQSLQGKTAFITGGARGIGLAIAHQLADAGVNLALADLDQDALDDACDALRRKGVEAAGFVLDVADRAAFYRTADQVEAAFGKIHMLFNNAGVSYIDAPIDETPDNDLDWVVGVNVMGVLNGIKAFVPKLKSHGEGGHVVNTSSFLGLYLPPNQRRSLYSATKTAVIAISEGLRDSLAPFGIGVSVLCPSPVKTSIASSGLRRPVRLGGPAAAAAERKPMAHDANSAIAPETVARFVLHAIKTNAFYIITHPWQRPLFEARTQAILEAFDAWSAFSAAEAAEASAMGR